MTQGVLNGFAVIVPAVIETELIEPLVAYSGVAVNVGTEELKSVCLLIAEVLLDNGLLSVHLLTHLRKHIDPSTLVPPGFDISDYAKPKPQE
eukprot:2103562-Prorocentrum_lima.AAC.1